ncbi:MAG: serine hydrolase [Bacteroidia bacterium]|nr:MAG: serine hydrolase [Bacteroidia bacterium]
MRKLAYAFLVALVAWGQMLTPKEALHRLLSSSSPEKSWFAESFLAEAPLSQVKRILREFTQSQGRYLRVSGSQNPYRVEYERAFVPAYITLDSRGRISGLRFLAPRRKWASWAEAQDSLLRRPELVSVLVREGETDLLAIRPDTPLAVGSTFKVAVLAALEEAIQAGQLAWEDIVRLDSSWKSLRSGLLQDWPAGAPLTLYTLAALMIAESDNTATDALIALLGEERLRPYARRNWPFLSTQVFFKLILTPAGHTLRRPYAAASAGERALLLEKITRLPLPRAGELAFDLAPEDLLVGWRYSLRELDTLFRLVEKLPLMSINPGLAEKAEWAHIAYKGGSYPGVRNMTSVLLTPAGKRYLVAMTWNSPTAVDEDAFFQAYGGLLDLAAKTASSR